MLFAVVEMAQPGTLLCLCQLVAASGTRWHTERWALHREGVKYVKRIADEYGVPLETPSTRAIHV